MQIDGSVQKIILDYVLFVMCQFIQHFDYDANHQTRYAYKYWHVCMFMYTAFP